MKKVIATIEEEEPQKEYSLNVAALVEDYPSEGVITIDGGEAPKKRGPGRPRKDGSSLMYTDNSVSARNDRKQENTLDKKFEKGYLDNAKLLYSAIMQSDDIYNNIEDELRQFRKSKSYGGRNRLSHMSDFMNTQVGLINTKITAVRELDSIRHKINDLVMKKEQLMKDTNEDNADKTVMDAYYALVNAPRYGLPVMKQNLSPTTINTGINLSGGALQSSNISQPVISARSEDSIISSPAPISVSVSDDPSFDEYQRNLTPVQKKMIADKDPNIKTVVVYDQTTGNKWFDVVNVTTGVSIPGIQRPAEFLLDAMRIDARNGIASNSNTNMSFPLVLTGTRVSDEI